MALLGVAVGDADAQWTDDPAAHEFPYSIRVSKGQVFALTRDEFEAMCVAMNRLREMYFTRSMKIRTE
jgi:hypothetical protein